MKHSKKNAAGLEERMELLRANGFAEFLSAAIPNREKGCAVDDILDACAACWTALRIFKGKAIPIPVSPERDEKELLMKMWR
jgi:predicted RNase H-like nuclease